MISLTTSAMTRTRPYRSSRASGAERAAEAQATGTRRSRRPPARGPRRVARRPPRPRARARASRAPPPRAAPRPFASSAPIRPESTSPVPAVASAGVPPGLTATGPPGTAISVSSPLSSTTAPLRSAASRTDASRWRAISAESRSSSRPSSPSCGVSTVGAARPCSSSSRPAWALRPSASISSGVSTGRRHAAGERPAPGRCGRGPGRARRRRPARPARSTASTPAGLWAPSASGRPRLICSSRRRSTAACAGRGHRDLDVAGAGALRPTAPPASGRR